MIYTLTTHSAYSRDLASHGRPMKKGAVPEEGYPGGSVWQTREEAEAFVNHRSTCETPLVVYGVAADWQRDTRPSIEKGAWHDLLRHADLIPLD